jgi:CubicO group peptidase (beta-lactamase class C family)
MKRQISTLLHLFIVLALSACGITTPSPSPMPSPTNVPTVTPVFAGAADLDRSFQTMREDLRLAAISAGIVEGDRLVWNGAYGLPDVEAKRPAVPETLFPMGSVSKTITGAALLHLWESERFNLDDDVNRYLADLVGTRDGDGKYLGLCLSRPPTSFRGEPYAQGVKRDVSRSG